MPSGKRSKQQRREAAAVAAKPPPVRSKGAPRGARQASPRVLAIGGAVVALVAIAIVLALVLSRGSSSGIPAGTPTIGRVDTNSLPGAGDIATLYKGIPQNGLYLGSPNAPVQMTMFIDLQCPVCQNFEVTAMPTIVRKYIRTNKVRLHVRPWAFIGNDSFKARKYMIAASFQNKAFQFAGVLYDNQQPENSGWVTDRMLANIAASVPGLNVPQVFAEAGSSKVNAIASDVDSSAQTDKVQGTPTILIGKSGATPKDVAAAGAAPTLQQVETAITKALGS